jgi:transposase
LRILKTGKNARVIYRANALNLRSKGLTMAEVADFLEITVRTVYNIERSYERGGLEKALHDDPRPGAPIQHDDRVKSYVVATVCSDPPEGFDRWTLDLIQTALLEKKVVDSISRENIRLILKEHDLKPWQQHSWCVPKIDEEFIERMEDVLDVYERPQDSRNPVVCLDEKPIQLLDHVRPDSGIAPGKPARVDYEYKRKGTCNVFCAVEPKAGRYIAEVTNQRKGSDFAEFLNDLQNRYLHAEKITLVMDNLNTHTIKSLIDRYGEQQGRRIWERFEVHYTPKHGSWLNQAEIAINIYARQCLGRSRIPDMELLRKKTNAWLRYINNRQVTINWTFTKAEAQKKFKYS